MPRDSRRGPFEKYEIERSPFAQHPTQKEIGDLVGESRDNLRLLIDYKEQFIVRRKAFTGKKLRDLRYPVSRLRHVHERLKNHLNKIKQPSYLFSPRKHRSQRDNAELHLDQDQYLTLDLKQFYPSTTAKMIRHWFEDELGMYPDVAGLLAHLSTIDDRAALGSPLTPVLCALVHRRMFDKIAALCDQWDLRYSVWVDDLTISGKFISGEVVQEIREIIKAAGLRSHKIKYRTGNRPVYITGIGVVGSRLIAPNSLNLRIKSLWDSYHHAVTTEERGSCVQALLTQLGNLKHIVGAGSSSGRKVADQMNSLRQKRVKMHKDAAAKAASDQALRSNEMLRSPSDAPFEF